MHSFSHSFISIKLSSTWFEQIIGHHQEAISVHAAYTGSSESRCALGCSVSWSPTHT